MRVSTMRFGEIEVRDDEIIVFPKGILGFEHVSRYLLLRHREDSAFYLLQGIDDPGVAFIVVDPRTLRPDYRVQVPAAEVAELGLGDPGDAAVFAIVTVPADLADMTANLQAPLVISQRSRLGRQVVMADGPYGLRHNILAEMKAAAFAARQQDTSLKKTV